MERPRKSVDGQALRRSAWTSLQRWGWALPVTLALLGMLLGMTLGDHRLASRSAAVLLVSAALIVVQEWLR